MFPTAQVERPICIEMFRTCQKLGRVILRQQGKTVAAGVVREILPDLADVINTFDSMP